MGECMNLRECTEFANRHPVSFLATIDRDWPRARAMTLWFADETGFYYNSIGSKNVVAQLEKNPMCEACFMAPPHPPEPVEMMRVSGAAEFLKDRRTRERLLEDRPILMKLGIESADDPLLSIFRISHGDIRFWRMENYLMGKQTAWLTF
jgi:uncharacterized pyridoxamine 5'-phosphate oxidase family protein